MHDFQPSLKIVRKTVVRDPASFSSIGLVISFEGREVRMSISMAKPAVTYTSEIAAAIAELRLLQKAIENIVTQQAGAADQGRR